ncbi:MAG: 3-oxoacyl-ACP reductase [Solirubrobacterales bacterium]|nr:3-oxoacyl-ACP reductase [Solirubrobacterales bacterium]
MADRYQQLINTPVGKILSKQIGLPSPIPLKRYEPGQAVIDGPVLLGAAAGSTLVAAIAQTLAGAEAEVSTPVQEEARQAAADAGVAAGIFNPETATDADRFKALVFDASGIVEPADLIEAYEFFHATIRRVGSGGRIIVLGRPPDQIEDPQRAVAQRALEGLTRSMGKEVRRASTSQLIYVADGAEGDIESTLRFFLSPKSAYVSGQVVRIGRAVGAWDSVDWDRPLASKVALVTGASRGIGASIADVLARDGAHVVGIDVPPQEQQLEEVTGRLGGSALTLDITDEDAPERIAAYLLDSHGGVDVVVHNAGVTRDKTLGRMSDELWRMVIDINLRAPHRIDQALFGRQAVHENGRVVLVSSISGIAGNAGQTNYSTSKAGIIGMVEAYSGPLAERACTINAVAPGFIETQMTAAMPIATREAGRRMNSLQQGGLPVDVAETIAWFANPASAGVNGNVTRVCGQSLIGA